MIPQVIGLVNSRRITSIRNTNRNIHGGRPMTITLCIRHPPGTELRYTRSNARGNRLSTRHHRQQCQNHKNSLHGGEIRLSVCRPLLVKSQSLFEGWWYFYWWCAPSGLYEHSNHISGITMLNSALLAHPHGSRGGSTHVICGRISHPANFLWPHPPIKRLAWYHAR